MSELTPEQPAADPIKKGSWAPIRLHRLAAKELRETMRDRRTIVTLFLMPLLVYPILSLLLQGFLVSDISTSESTTDDKFVFVVDVNDDGTVARAARMRFYGMLQQGYAVLQSTLADREKERQGAPKPEQPLVEGEPRNLFEDHFIDPPGKFNGQSLQEIVSTGEADAGLEVEWLGEGPNAIPKIEFVYVADSLRSLEALAFINDVVDSWNVNWLRNYMAREGVRPPYYVKHGAVTVPWKRPQAISFAALVPLILTLMTITGAVYPAIDLTAGERERGTLESLIAAPVPRIRVLLGKLVAVMAVALLTAILNLAGMTVTIWVFQLDEVLFGEQGLTLFSILQVFGLLVLFSGFFSSVLLVISSFARSFKEGQAYLIPLMLMALIPGLVSLKPDLDLNGIWAVIPLVNIVLLARDVLSGSVLLAPALVAIVSTIFYAALAVTMAARFFGTPQVLYGQSQGIGSVLGRPKERQVTASASLAMLCMALLFPASFLWQGVLARVADQAMKNQVALVALGVFLVFFVIPFIVAKFHRVAFFTGFRVQASRPLCYLGAIVLGIGFGPLLMQGIAWSSQLIELLTPNSNSEAPNALVERAEQQVAFLRELPFWGVLVAFALVPAVFEELFFRGLLFQSLRKSLSPWKTILATAVMFGAFHLISTSGLSLSRLVPTTVMGIILGWVCWRSGSVIPGILLHAIHNSISLSAAYYRDEMVARNWIQENQANVPVWILLIAIACATIGVFLLWFARAEKQLSTDGQPLPDARLA